MAVDAAIRVELAGAARRFCRRCSRCPELRHEMERIGILPRRPGKGVWPLPFSRSYAYNDWFARGWALDGAPCGVSVPTPDRTPSCLSFRPPAALADGRSSEAVASAPLAAAWRVVFNTP